MDIANTMMRLCMCILSAHNICSTMYDFIIYTVTVCKIYAGDNTTILELFNYLIYTVLSK